MFRVLFLCALLTTTPVYAQTYTQNHVDPVDRAIHNIKNQESLSRKMIVASAKMMGGGVAIAGTGVVLKSILPEVVAAYGGDAVANFMIKMGPSIFKVGLFMTGVSVFVALVVETKPAGAFSRATDYYQTVQGFQDYLSLPPEQMKQFAQQSPELEQLVLSLNETLSKIQE